MSNERKTERTKPCPKCAGEAVAQNSHEAGHAAHVFNHALHSGNPVFIGLSAVAVGFHGYKQHRFTCRKCKHKFFGW